MQARPATGANCIRIRSAPGNSRSSSWQKVTKGARASSIENGIRFPDTRSAEDSCFLTCSLLAARRIAGDDGAIYHYAIHPASTSQRKDPARYRNRLASFRALVAFAQAKGLYKPYRGTLRLLVLKKGCLLAAKDYLTNNLFK